jgi:hypothetical protein
MHSLNLELLKFNKMNSKKHRMKIQIQISSTRLNARITRRMDQNRMLAIFGDSILSS